MLLIFLLALSSVLQSSLAIPKTANEDDNNNNEVSAKTQQQTISVLPYYLKQPNQAEETNIQNGEQGTKRYTLLTSATSSSNSIPPMDETINKNKDKIPIDDVALAKIDYNAHSWPHVPTYLNGHQQQQHHHHHNGDYGFSHYDLWHDVNKYYYTIIGAAGSHANNGRPAHGFGGAATTTHFPATLLLLLNLGLVSYVLLTIIAALARLLSFGTIFNFAPRFPNNPSHAFSDNFAHYGGGEGDGYWSNKDDFLKKFEK